MSSHTHHEREDQNDDVNEDATSATTIPDLGTMIKTNDSQTKENTRRRNNPDRDQYQTLVNDICQ